MKRLIFALSLLAIVGMTVDTADAAGRRLGRRCAPRCCIVTTCCVVTPSPTVCCQPATTPVVTACTPAAIVHSAPVVSAPVTSYKPASSGCAECDATANNSTYTGSISSGQSVVQAVPQPAVAMTQGQGSEMSHGQVLAQINAYLDRSNGSICGLKNQFPEYGTIINSLSANEKMRVAGATICYPSLEVWNTRPDIRADLIRVLTQNGVL